jgi:hypothetical protein
MTAEMVLKTILRGIEKESPTILTVLGTTGIVTTVIMAIRATPIALYLLDAERVKRNREGTGAGSLSKLDIIKLTWKCYLPVALMGGTTIACFVGAHSINIRRQVALAGLYSVTEASFKKYQEKVIEIVGKNKEEKIYEAFIEDKIKANPASKNEVIVTGGGETLFYDSWSGRYFKSDMQKVRKIQNDLNYNFIGGHDMYLPLNMFYEELGLESVEAGNDIGWSLDHGQLDIRFTTKLTDKDEACVVIEYRMVPKHF